MLSGQRIYYMKFIGTCKQTGFRNNRFYLKYIFLCGLSPFFNRGNQSYSHSVPLQIWPQEIKLVKQRSTLVHQKSNEHQKSVYYSVFYRKICLFGRLSIRIRLFELIADFALFGLTNGYRYSILSLICFTDQIKSYIRLF